ncbi:MAG TPA: rhombosortase [Opitutaceae bacterium]
MKRFPILTLTLAGLALAIHAIPGAASWLEFSRTALERGAIWRLATAHLTHFSADHLRWDVVALILLGAIAENLSRRAYALTLAASATVIGIAIWLFQPQFDTYRGLSGLDSALFTFIAGRLLFGERPVGDWISPLVALVAIAGFGLKCGYEIATASTMFVASDGFAPVPLAHLAGAATGLTGARCSIRQRAVEQVLQLRDADSLDRAVEPELFDQRSVSKRI